MCFACVVARFIFFAFFPLINVLVSGLENQRNNTSMNGICTRAFNAGRALIRQESDSEQTKRKEKCLSSRPLLVSRKPDALLRLAGYMAA